MPMPSFNKPLASRQEIATSVREAIAEQVETERVMTRHEPPEPVYVDEAITDLVTGEEIESDESHTGRVTNPAIKLSKLVDDEFPFDESQLAAINGMVDEDYATLTGAAGTGKTTVTKALVDRLIQTQRIGAVDMRGYWHSDSDKRTDSYVNPYDLDDDYVYDESNSVIPTIAMCAFTGRASQMIKRNFPRDWHGNIMTIHRMLGFVPESYQDWDPEWYDDETGVKGSFRTKMRFMPTYNEFVKMPWDIILVDEAGMLGLDLWHQLFAAMKEGCRLYFIGDINQLQPVHGKSVFGFAMAKWPTFELTKVHRQQGVDNPIVDNAWQVIHGLRPEPKGKFQLIELPGDAGVASKKVRAIARKLREMGIYEPIRDSIITPINGESGGAGYALGQVPLNREFALMFNPESENPRYMIDGGRDRKQFAVGDKVMATRNDWSTGITNGMTGIIQSIVVHEGYAGDRDRVGLLKDVNARFAVDSDGDDIAEFDLESLENSMLAIDDGKKKSKEKRERGPASHIITVQFGEGEHGFEIPFSTLAEVGSLQMAYVTTCHKMQGGEAPTVIIILHESHRRMLTREWLYTAITRASDKCIILYTDLALRVALNRQAIKGHTLREKVQSFMDLMDPTGETQKLVQLPMSTTSALTLLERPETRDEATSRRLMSDEVRTGGLSQLIASQRAKAEPKPEASQTVESLTHTPEVHIHVSKVIVKNIFTRPARQPAQPVESPETVDRGVIQVEPPTQKPASPVPELVAPRLVPQHWASREVVRLRDLREQSQRLLSWHPARDMIREDIYPAEPIKPKLSGQAGLAMLFGRK